MEVEVTVILDLPEVHTDQTPHLPLPVVLNRDDSIIALALLLGMIKKEETPSVSGPERKVHAQAVGEGVSGPRNSPL